MAFVTSKIANVTYALITLELARLLSAGKITNLDTSTRGGAPDQDSVYGNKMGTTESSYLCATCNGKYRSCPGHSGHILTKYPVKDPLAMNLIVKYARAICIFCSHPYSYTLLNKSDQFNKIINDSIEHAKKKLPCKNCKSLPIRILGKDKGLRIKFIYNLRLYVYYNDLLKFVLKRVPPMFTAKNKNFPIHLHIRNVIIAPAVATRILIQTPKMSGASDITNLLKLIVILVNKLNSIYEYPDFPVVDGLLDLDMATTLMSLGYSTLRGVSAHSLLLAYFTLIKKPPTGLKIQTNQNRIPTSIAGKMNSKDGTIRLNLLGKRVDYMIRSVIIGDTNILIDLVGIPILHALNTEVILVVNSNNISRLQTYVINARTLSYPHAPRVKKLDLPGIINTVKVNKPITLSIGDIVYRNLIDGDYININRQPTLIFSSVSGLRVRINRESLCITINPSICNYFNADFDGDNMNCIISQDVKSSILNKYLTSADRWFISPQKMGPLVGAFQDALIGLCLITLSGVVIPSNKAKWIIGNSNFKFVLKNKLKILLSRGSITGRLLVSVLLPKINYSVEVNGYYNLKYAPYLKYNVDDLKVVIEDGILLSGTLLKTTSGQNVANSIFHVIANDYGNVFALNVIYNLQQMAYRYFMIRGFTIGLKDLIVSKTSRMLLKDNISKYVNTALNTMKLYNDNRLPLTKVNMLPGGGVALYDFYKDMNLDLGYISNVFSLLTIDSNFLKLVLSGSKGSMVNFRAIVGCIGQVFVEGKPFQKQNGGRILPYFTRNDLNPGGRGFIGLSFILGITNDVYAYMSGLGRQTLISNALSTSITGYANRVATKNLLSIVVDNCFHSSKGNSIIQLLAFLSGFNISNLLKVKIPTITLTDLLFEAKYRTTLKDLLFLQLSKDRKYMILCVDYCIRHNPLNYKINSDRYIPFNPKRVILNHSRLVGKKSSREFIIDVVKKFCLRVDYSFTHPEAKIIPNYVKESLNVIKFIIRAYFAYKVIGHLSLTAVINSLNLINLRINNSLSDAGLPVGLLCAQFIYLPLTQYILDSKHRAGARDPNQKNVVVRTELIINARPIDRMLLPTMTIALKDQSRIREFASYIKLIRFKDIVLNAVILFLPVNKNGDNLFKGDVYTVLPSGKPPTAWCIRFGLSILKMINNNLDISLIANVLQSLNHTIAICGPLNDQPFVRIYILNAGNRKLVTAHNFLSNDVMKEYKSIPNMILRGINGIRETSVKTIDTISGPIEIISTIGSNLQLILMFDIVDRLNTHTDSIIDTFSVRGIFCARLRLLNLITVTIPSTHNFTNSLVADLMTSTGSVTAINRKGMSIREVNNVGLRASLQTPADTFHGAAVALMNLPITGLSGSLIMGDVPNLGTKFNSIIIDTESIVLVDAVNFDDM